MAHRFRPALLALALLVPSGCGSGSGRSVPGDGGADAAVSDPGAGLADAAGPDGSMSDALGTDTDAGTAPSDADALQPSDVADAVDGDSGPGPLGWKVFQELLPTPSDFVLRGIWGSQGGDAIAVGQDGAILRRSGASWTLESFGVFPYLHGVDGRSQSDVVAVGLGGVRTRFDGQSWAGGDACATDAGCDDGDPCTADVCLVKKCLHAPEAKPGCCGTAALDQGFDQPGAASALEIVDLYAADPENGGMVWHVVSVVHGKTGDLRATSAPNALYFGDPTATCPESFPDICPSYGNGKTVGATVTLPPVDLPAADRITLRFQLFLETEGGSFDLLSAQVVEGDVATDVWTKEELPGGSQGSTQGFVGVEVDLSSYQKRTIRLRFSFDSQDSFANDFEGVYLDDLRIDTECGDGTGVGADPKAPTFFDVAASPDGAYYAVGQGGAIWRFEPSKGWVDATTATRSDWYGLGVGEDLLVVGGSKGGLLERKGMLFERPDTGVGTTIRAVAILPDGARVAVGDGGVVLAAAPGQAWSRVSALATKKDLLGVDGGSLDDLTVVGAGGTILRGAADALLPEVSTVSTALRGVAVTSSGVRYAVGDSGVILADSGGGWIPKTKVSNDALHAIWATGDDVAVAVGSFATIAHLDPAGGEFARKQAPISKNLNGVYGFSADDVWAVGLFGTVLHYDGDIWSSVDMGGLTVDLNDVKGADPGHLFLAGAGGAVIERTPEGDLRFLLSNTTATLRGVFALDAQHVWAVGQGGTIMFGSGSAWALQPIEPQPAQDGSEIPVTDNLFAVWAAAIDDAWAAGADGRVVHFDGKVWKVVQEQEDPRTLRGIAGTGKDDVVMVGSVGAVLNWDGKSWRVLETGSVSTLHDLWIGAKGEILVVGDKGTVLRLER